MTTRVTQCYADSKGNIHATKALAEEAQREIERQEELYNKQKHMRALVQVFNSNKREFLRMHLRNERRHEYAPVISDRQNHMFMQEALDELGLQIVPK